MKYFIFSLAIVFLSCSGSDKSEESNCNNNNVNNTNNVDNNSNQYCKTGGKCYDSKEAYLNTILLIRNEEECLANTGVWTSTESPYFQKTYRDHGIERSVYDLIFVDNQMHEINVDSFDKTNSYGFCIADYNGSDWDYIYRKFITPNIIQTFIGDHLNWYYEQQGQKEGWVFCGAEEDWGNEITEDATICNVKQPLEVCGNGIIETGENCDASQLGTMESCAEYSQIVLDETYTSGTITCDASCHWDFSDCQ